MFSLTLEVIHSTELISTVFFIILDLLIFNAINLYLVPHTHKNAS